MFIYTMEMTIHKHCSNSVMHTKFLFQKPERKGPPWSSGHADERIGGRESQRSDQLNWIHLNEDRVPPLMSRVM